MTAHMKGIIKSFPKSCMESGMESIITRLHASHAAHPLGKEHVDCRLDVDDHSHPVALGAKCNTTVISQRWLSTDICYVAAAQAADCHIGEEQESGRLPY